MKKQSLAVAVLICLFAIILSACGDNNLTMENYNKITVATLNQTTFEYEGGMTLSEVEDILGKYKSSSSSTVMGQTATAYVWGNNDKNITISFYNNKALLKAQVGL